MEGLILIIIIILELGLKTYSSDYLEGLIIEEPYYDDNLKIFRCLNDFNFENYYVNCDFLQQINIMNDYSGNPIMYSTNISKFTSGWNTSVYLGEFDSKYDYLISRRMNLDVDDYAFFELSFNILLIEPTNNKSLTEENFDMVVSQFLFD
jgi:hypothetical protein